MKGKNSGWSCGCKATRQGKEDPSTGANEEGNLPLRGSTTVGTPSAPGCSTWRHILRGRLAKGGGERRDSGAQGETNEVSTGKTWNPRSREQRKLWERKGKKKALSVIAGIKKEKRLSIWFGGW